MFAQTINILLLIRRELFYINRHEEMLNYNIFPLLQMTELCSSFSNNCGGELRFSDTTNT